MHETRNQREEKQNKSYMSNEKYYQTYTQNIKLF